MDDKRRHQPGKNQKDAEADYDMTPAMLRAGARALMAFNLDYETPEQGVERIYWEILNAKYGRLR